MVSSDDRYERYYDADSRPTAAIRHGHGEHVFMNDVTFKLPRTRTVPAIILRIYPSRHFISRGKKLPPKSIAS
jgi:hypothetical protein